MGFEVTTMNKTPGLSYSLPFRLAGLFRQDRVDLVHCHNFGSLVYGAIGGRLAGVGGVLYTAHGPEMPYGSRKAVFQRLPLVDRIITVSDYVRDSAINKAGLSPSRVTTIHNGVDVGRYSRIASTREQVRTQLGLTSDEPLLGVVARLTPEKDHDTLLQSLVLVRNDFDNVKLAIAGEGELMDALKKKVEHLGLSRSVWFLGNRGDVPELLQAMDLFVLSSRQEGLGITLLEAMAVGLPVVATNTGGIPEIVISGETGLLVPPEDASRFAEAVKWMLSHRDDGKEMGLRGQKRALQQFGVERMVEQYEAVYDEVLAAKKH
jgi:glycosyltransferase involved in cell wall biosynthesis